MATTSETLAFDRGVRAVLEIVLPEKAEAIIGFRADPKLQARIEELARKSTEGELTEDEQAEYAGYVRANKFVAILKRQARHVTNEPREPVIDAAIDAEKVLEMAKNISPEFASILYLRVVEGLAFEEIASLMGISPATARTRYYREQNTLRAELRKPKTE